MWTRGLAAWYRDHGRHGLPWRSTAAPWPVLVSEVMLQQTSVARVLPRWERFLLRWPHPRACADAPLEDVLGEWQGLGYPRRARALWLTARRVNTGGWPGDERGLRELPGVGIYTARALLAFTDLGDDGATAPPRDVNVDRVAARAALGREPETGAGAEVEAALVAGSPTGMTLREYTYALFDVGALHCRAVPRCQGCPLHATCLWARRGVPPRRPASRPPYRGSFRQMRGAVLAAALANPDADRRALRSHLREAGVAVLDRFDDAVESLVADGLLPQRRSAIRMRE